MKDIWIKCLGEVLRALAAAILALVGLNAAGCIAVPIL